MKRPNRSTSHSALGTRHSPLLTGFTLTEMIITVGLVLVVMLGVTRIFSLTSQTVGTGMAVSAVTRDQRGAKKIYETDFAGLARTNPALAIWSETVPGYLDRAQLDASAIETFRTDRIGFFATGKFSRQTANTGFLSSSVTSEQAYVWYGHLVLPDNGGNMYYDPGANTQPITPGSISPAAGADYTSNPNNYFARQWVLGRVAILLKQKAAIPSGGPVSIFDKDGVEQAYINGASGYQPLGIGSLAGGADTSTGPLQPRIEQSRYDLAGFTGDPFATVNLSGNWWDNSGFGYRFQSDPFPRRPLTAAGAAKATPQFLPGCTSFIVEFAGDYDGAAGLDSDPIDPDIGPPNGPMPTVNRTRWYGFPRDVNNDGDTTDLEDVRPVATPQTFVRVNTPTSYVTAWNGNPATWPTFIRITYTLHDANGRLADPQPAEVIFRIK